MFVVRKGNPKNITTWADLTKPGIEVITPNPFTSGGARWNVMAAYGQAVKGGGTEADGVDYLTALFKNVPVQDDSARKSLQTFTSGKGDVLLAYENEAIFAQQNGQAIDYIVPDVDDPDREPRRRSRPPPRTPSRPRRSSTSCARPRPRRSSPRTATARCVDGVESPYDFPTAAGLFTIADFGGWTEVTKKFFDPAGSIMADVERRDRRVGWLTPSVTLRRPVSGRRKGIGEPQHRHRVRRRAGHAVAEPARAHPAGRRGVAGPEERVRRRSGTQSRRRRRRRPSGSRSSSALVRRASSTSCSAR